MKVVEILYIGKCFYLYVRFIFLVVNLNCIQMCRDWELLLCSNKHECAATVLSDSLLAFVFLDDPIFEWSAILSLLTLENFVYKFILNSFLFRETEKWSTLGTVLLFWCLRCAGNCHHRNTTGSDLSKYFGCSGSKKKLIPLKFFLLQNVFRSAPKSVRDHLYNWATHSFLQGEFFSLG